MATDKKFDFSNLNTIDSTSTGTNISPSDTVSTPKNDGTNISHERTSRVNAATINVTINDQQSPIVILFGPSGCGKTMTLVRIARYLGYKGYKFSPDRAFKNSTDNEYQSLCDNFSEAVNNDMAADGTRYIDFMLLRLSKGSDTVCQFLESPGEYLFDYKSPNASFPAYFQQIINASNRKIWIFFLEQSLSNEAKRAYINKITQQITYGEDDRFIFLVNKIDRPETSQFVTNTQSVDTTGLRNNYVDINFAGLTGNDKFKQERIFSVKELFKIVGFQTGTYTPGNDENGQEYKTFQAGSDSHPKRLWDTIYGAIIGDW